MSEHASEFLRLMQAQLQALQKELSTQLEQRRSASAAVELDQSKLGRLSRMDAMQQQAMSLASDQRAAQHLLRVRSALKRLSDGSYGICLKCAEPLPQARLGSDPCAVLCMECQLESDAELARDARRKDVLGRGHH